MIDINLVPLNARKQRRSSLLPNFPLDVPKQALLGAAAVLALLIIVHVVLLAVMGVQAVNLGFHQIVWNRLVPEKNKIDALGSQMRDFKKKQDNINQILSPKATDWAQRLNVISDSVSKGLWLTKLELSGNFLNLEGTVIAKSQNEAQTIGEFVDDLKKDAFFMKDVAEVQVDSIQRRKKGATDVADFDVTVKFK